VLQYESTTNRDFLAEHERAVVGDLDGEWVFVNDRLFAVECGVIG
jgi:hypothetical protein